MIFFFLQFVSLSLLCICFSLFSRDTLMFLCVCGRREGGEKRLKEDAKIVRYREIREIRGGGVKLDGNM